MKKLLSLFVALIATCTLWAGKVITYKATSKLSETTSYYDSGLHTNAFNVSISSHTFSNGTGTITFSGEVTSIGDYAFDGCSGLTSITIPNSVTSIGYFAFGYCTGLTSITIPSSVTSIGDRAFPGCSGLTSITIPNSVTSIGNQAFYDCSGLDEIYTYAMVPPSAYESTFEIVSQHTPIHVPAGTIKAYQKAVGWSRFLHFYEMSELPEGTPVDSVGVTVEGNYATFTWPVNPTASSYTLTITKDGEVFCTLTFNSLGQLVGMGFAPARSGASAAENTAYGYSFVITGLESNSSYSYSFTANDGANNIIESHNGSFVTESSTAINTIDAAQQSTKLLRDGQILIQRGDRLYDLRGQEVK